MSEPILSICVCCRNAAQRIEDTLWSMFLQTAAPDAYEIVVVDNASADVGQLRSVIQLIDHMGRIRFFEETRIGLSHARNRAVQESRGRFVLFIDDDAVANVRLAEHYIQALQEHRPDVFGGNVFPLFDIQPESEQDYSYWPQWSLKHFGNGDRWLEAEEYFIGTNIGARRDLLIDHPFRLELGRKGDTLTGGEEWFLGGSHFKKWFAAGAYVFHKVPRKRMQVDYLANRFLSSPQQIGQRIKPWNLLFRWLKATFAEGKLFLRKLAFRAALMRKIWHLYNSK